MPDFNKILNRAIERKGGKQVLESLLPDVLSAKQLATIPDHRYLSASTKCVNQAGFSWTVIENKWPQFEEAFFGFDLERLAHLPDEAWEAYLQDKRVVRSWQKISALRHNVFFMRDVALEHGSFANLIAHWPLDDQFGLQQYLKKNGSRLGGMTGVMFLRRLGKGCYLLSADVCLALQHAGLKIDAHPTSQRDLKLIQQTLNIWHEQTGLPYSHLSKICAYSVGENYPADFIQQQMDLYD